MTYRVAINGYGRIGQAVLRASYERASFKFERDSSIEVVAINELADIDTIAYLTRYDSTFGRFPSPVEVHDKHCLQINEKHIQVTHHSKLESLPWHELGIDLVMECTGQFGNYASVVKHLDSGAKKVLLSQPGDETVEKTIVYGSNHSALSRLDRVVSCASCTSNAVVPVLDVIHKNLGISAGSLTTIHSAMNDQPTIDAYHHQDLRRTRSSMNNVVPVDTGLAKGVERLLPELKGKLSATAMRVPTINVSAIELALCVDTECSADKVNDLLKRASNLDEFGVLHYTEEPLASSDFVGDVHSSIVDGSQTRVSSNKLIKILIWFDNEWAYANRMLDVASYWLSR